MPRSRFLASAVILTLLIGAGLLWSSEGDAAPVFTSPFTEQPPLVAPETAVLVDAEILAMRAEEDTLIEDAIVTTTTIASTTSTTSTTTPSTTTTTSASATPDSGGEKDTPPPTSPPTTNAPTTTTSTQGGGYVSGAESEFSSRINSLRSSNGLGSLSRSGSLDSYARSWAKKLAEDGSLSHSNIGSLLGNWSSVGENVGVGGSVGSIFDALVASSGHRENMLGDFTHMGIGVYQDSSGTIWTAHVFAR